MIFVFKDNTSLFGCVLVFAFDHTSALDALSAQERMSMYELGGRFALWKIIQVSSSLKGYKEE
jgi:hypothetical protein